MSLRVYLIVSLIPACSQGFKVVMFCCRQLRSETNDRCLADVCACTGNVIAGRKKIHEIGIRIQRTLAISHAVQMVYLQGRDHFIRNLLQWQLVAP